MNDHIFRELESGLWNEPNPARCPCRGRGWMLSNFDTWHRCRTHGYGVPHPEDEASDFNGDGHLVQQFRNYYQDLQVRSNLTPKAFNDLCRNEHPTTPQEWCMAAEKVLENG